MFLKMCDSVDNPVRISKTCWLLSPSEKHGTSDTHYWYHCDRHRQNSVNLVFFGLTVSLQSWNCQINIFAPTCTLKSICQKLVPVFRQIMEYKRKIKPFLSSARCRRGCAMKLSQIGDETWLKKKQWFFFEKLFVFDEKNRLNFLESNILMKILYAL